VALEPLGIAQDFDLDDAEMRALGAILDVNGDDYIDEIDFAASLRPAIERGRRPWDQALPASLGSGAAGVPRIECGRRPSNRARPASLGSGAAGVPRIERCRRIWFWHPWTTLLRGLSQAR
jgi:hypothetical protein